VSPTAELAGVVLQHHTRRGVVRALDGVDLTLPAGRHLALVGSSGAGKSSLLRVLLGLDTPDAGTVRAFDRPVVPGPAGALRWLRAAVGVVLQDAGGSLDPRWTVGRVVAEPLRLLAVPGDHPARVADVLAAVGLDPAVAGSRPGSLSGGQRTRVALARALAARPRLLVADEVLSGADVVLRRQLLDLLLGLAGDEGLQLLLVTHDLAVAAALGGDVAVLDAGRVVEQGSAAAVLRSPAHPATAGLVDAVLRLPA